MQQAGVSPVRVKRHDDELGVDVVRIVGYRGRCPCGETTPRRDTYNQARREILQHKREAHGHRPR